MYRLLLAIYLILMTAIPITVASIPILNSQTLIGKYIGIVFCGPLYVLSLIIVGGVLAKTGQSAIKKGKVKRDLNNKEYGIRRLHAVPWTLIYYFSPVYFIVLSIPVLKKILFRLFGYSGSLNFTVHPDTWLRDLPCLHIENGAYLANKSSIATNMVLMHGMLLVDDVHVGENSCVGMGAMIGPGTKMSSNTILDTAVLSGVRTIYKSQVKVGEMSGIQHAVFVDNGSVIGSGSIVGLRCKIGPNIKIPEGSHIHAGTRLRTQQEAESYFSEETGTLTRLRSKIIARASDLIKTQTLATDVEGDLDVSTGDS